MKRCLVLLATLGLLVTLVGCGGPKKVELTFFETLTSPERTQYLQSVIKEYEAQHKGVTITMISPPYEQAENKLFQMLDAKQPLDIIESRDATVKQFVNNSQIDSLEPYLAKWEYKDDLLPVSLISARAVDEKAYLIPHLFFVKALYVRTDILKAHNMEVPTTIDELVADSIKLTDSKANRYGYIIRGKHNAWKVSQDYLSLSDIPDLDTTRYYWTADGTFAYKTSLGKAGLERYVRLFQRAVPKDGINWGFAEQINAFVSGVGVFLVQDPDAMAMIDKQLGKDKYSVFPLPLGSSGKAYQDFAFQGLSLVSYGKNKDEAWKFMSYLLSPEKNAELCKTYGALPVFKSTYEKNSFFNSEAFAAWNTELSNPDKYVFSKYPITSDKFAGWGPFQEELMQRLLLGKISSDDAIAQWADYWK